MAASVLRRVIDLHRSQLAGLVEIRGVAKLRPVYDQSRLELEEKLRRLVRGGKGSTFQAHHVRLVLGQVGVTVREIQGKVYDRLGDTGRVARELAPRHLVDAVERLQEHFKGTTPVIQPRQVAVFQRAYEGVAPSLLDHHESSSRLYGPPVIAKVRDQLSLSLVQGEGVEEAIDRVAGAAGIVAGERYRAERIVRTECLVGDTRVDAAVVNAAFRRWYEGPVVEVVTERGRQFTATPNHPMLARSGWTAVGQLVEGDDLVGHCGQEDACSSRDQDVAARHPTIGEVFDSLAAVGVRKRRRTAQPDFHGDGADGEVDTASPHRALVVGNFSALGKESMQEVFSPSDLSRSRFCLSCGLLLAIDEKRRCCRVSNLHARIFQATVDQCVAHTQLLRQGVRALAGQVAAHDVFGGDFDVSGVGTAALLEFLPGLAGGAHDPRVTDRAEDPSFAQAHLFRDGRRAESRAVQFDRVVSVRIRAFRGHVFNLSTPYGYFSIGGLYTGNTAYSYGVDKQVGMVQLAQQAPRLMKRLVATFDDRTGDDSVDLNGQTVPVDQPFVWHVKDSRGVPTGKVVRYMQPPNRPNDRELSIAWMADWPASPALDHLGEVDPTTRGL